MPFLDIDLQTLIRTIGYLGIFAIVFAESGLFIGFFLPGDSLLFTAGVLASQGYLDLGLLLVGTFVAAVVGDSVGYAFGKRVGPRIFTREDSFFFRRSHLDRAHAFYLKHGSMTIVAARFMPIVRTFAPILAGVGRMPYRTFLFYNIAGGLLWTVLLTLLGYFLGAAIPDVDRYLIPLVLAIVALSVLPGVVHVLRERRKKPIEK